MTTNTGARVQRTAYAWNSGIKAGEALVREYAIANGAVYIGEQPEVTGGRPGTPGAVYSRAWKRQSSGTKVHVDMTELIEKE